MRKILKNKIFLYLTEFFAGMSVMAVELGASRLMAPYFSSSQIVWTIIIGTIMIAMALGNIYGGKSADKNPDPDKLYLRVIVAAVWIALIPVIGKYVIILISGVLVFTVNSNFLIIAAFAACMIIFVFPLFLLGTVTPSLVKFTVDSLDDNGKTVGYLNASNTIGSIIGTFVPTFVSIPAVGTSITFLIFSGVLLLLAVIYFMSKKDGEQSNGKKSKSTATKVIAGIMIFALCCCFGHNNTFAFWTDELTYEGESIYNYLQVSEDDRKVALSTNVLFGVQSVYQKEAGLTGMYYDYAMAAPLMADIANKEKVDILILGMGTGTYATQCSRYFGNVESTGVEIDEKITELARQYFELPETVEVTTYDGRAYLDSISQRYDVIMVDAYQDITIPFQMSSVEFFTSVRNHLKEDGVMVVNMNMRGDTSEAVDADVSDGSDAGNTPDSSEATINTYLADTIASVFTDVMTVDVAGCTNRELFASNNGDMLSVFEKNLGVISDGEYDCTQSADRNAELAVMMQRVGENLVTYKSKGYLMTDDKAPVELLGMRMIDSIIADEVSIYKEIYEQQGFEGLMNAL